MITTGHAGHARRIPYPDTRHRHTGTTPTAHPDHEPASEAPHTRQARHTGTKDYCLRRSIPSRMRRHTQPRRKAPGNDGTARASAGPRMPAHTQRRVTGIPGQPGACFRRTAHVPAYAFEKTPRPARQARLHPPRGRQGHGKHIRCHDTPTATTPAGIISNNPGSYMSEKHQTLNTGDRNCTECLTIW